MQNGIKSFMNEKFLSQNESKILKGYAILWVIITHCAGEAGAFRNIPVLWNTKITTVLGNTGLGLFMFISGYGLYKSFVKSGLDGYWLKRYKTVFLPYSCMQILLCIVFIITGKEFDIFNGILSIIGITPKNSFDGSMWYISLALLFYVLFYLIFKFFKENQAVIILLVVSFILMFIVPYIWDIGGYCVIHFSIGTYISYVEEKGLLPDRILKSFTTLRNRKYIVIPLFFMFCIFIKVWEKTYRINWILENIYVLIGATFIFIFAKTFSNTVLVKPLAFYGTISFILYLIEMKTIVKPTAFIISTYSIKSLGFIVVIVLTVISTLLAIPINKFFTRIAGKKKTV